MFKKITKENIRTDYNHKESKSKPTKLMENILENIGNTPLVNLNRVKNKYGLKCNLYAKCEFFNSGGSVKDRIALRMIEEAENQKLIEPGKTTIIEPTSGNTGIGLALCACVKGYKTIIVMPMKMSMEKVRVLEMLGAKIVRTPTEAAYDDYDSHISVARRLNKSIEGSIILDQYTNPYNPVVHYDSTAEEIIYQLDNRKLDMFVAGAGTGGTITGISMKLKEKYGKNLTVVGVDPEGSILAEPESLNTKTESYLIEGIGYDFIPHVLDRSVVDKWMKSNDRDSFEMARDLVRLEGLLCGGSSGAAVSSAIKAAKSLEEGQNCVVILPDSIRNYMSKHVDEEWIKSNILSTENKETKSVFPDRTIKNIDLKRVMTIEENSDYKEAVEIMRDGGYDQLPVTNSANFLVGIIEIKDLLKLINAEKTESTKVKELMSVNFKKQPSLFKQFTVDSNISDLANHLQSKSYALITTPEPLNQEKVDDSQFNQYEVLHVCSKIDLLNYLVIEQKSATPDIK